MRLIKMINPAPATLVRVKESRVSVLKETYKKSIFVGKTLACTIEKDFAGTGEDKVSLYPCLKSESQGLRFYLKNSNLTSKIKKLILRNIT